MSLLPSLVSRVMLRNNVWGGGGGIRGGGGSLPPPQQRLPANSWLSSRPADQSQPSLQSPDPPGQWAGRLLASVGRTGDWAGAGVREVAVWGAEQRRRFHLFIWGGFCLRMTFPPPCSGFELLLVIWLARISWQPKVNWHLTEVFKEKWSCQWSRKGAKDNWWRSKNPSEWGAS